MDLIPDLPSDLGLECLVRIPHHHLSSAASVCRSWMQEIKLPEFWRRRKASGFTRKVVIMAQSRRELGSKNHAVYRLTLCEPEMGFWAELPLFSDGLPMYCQLVGVGLNLVMLGGWDPVSLEVSKSVFIYNFVSATWRRGADMPGCRRLFFACASDSDRTVFVAGGHDADKCALKSAMAYDVAQDEWTDLPDMARERDESKGVFHRGTFHVIGGYPTNMQGRFEASAEWFAMAAWQWGPVREDFLESATCPRDCVGDGGGGLFMCRGADVVEAVGPTWRVAAELPSDVRKTSYVTAWRGKMLVIGKEEFGGAYKAIVLDLKECKWERVNVEEGFSGHVQSGCFLEL